MLVTPGFRNSDAWVSWFWLRWASPQGSLNLKGTSMQIQVRKAGLAVVHACSNVPAERQKWNISALRVVAANAVQSMLLHKQCHGFKQ